MMHTSLDDRCPFGMDAWDAVGAHNNHGYQWLATREAGVFKAFLNGPQG